jgi:hypothetical protein
MVNSCWGRASYESRNLQNLRGEPIRAWLDPEAIHRSSHQRARSNRAGPGPAQDLSAADFRDVQGATTADAILDHGYDGDISIDNTSLRRGQRRVVLSIGNRSSHGCD